MLCSFGFARVNSDVPRGRTAHSISRGFIRTRLLVVGFIGVSVGLFGRYRSRMVHSVVHSGAHWCRRVHSGSLGFTLPRMCIVAFIRVVIGSNCAPWGRRGVVGFIRVPVGSLGCVMGASDSLSFAWDNLCAPMGRRIHSRFTWEGQGVVGFIRITVGSLRRA